MIIASVYARQDGTIAHIIDDTFPITPDANTTRVIQFDADSYPTEYAHISANTKAAFWDGANLQIDSAVYVDAAWITARQNEISQAATIEAEDETERSNLLNQYNAALTQISNDLADVASGITAMQAQPNSVTKTVVLGMLTIQQHQLNREQRTLNALRAVLRSGLNGT